MTCVYYTCVQNYVYIIMIVVITVCTVVVIIKTRAKAVSLAVYYTYVEVHTDAHLSARIYRHILYIYVRYLPYAVYDVICFIPRDVYASSLNENVVIRAQDNARRHRRTERVISPVQLIYFQSFCS